MGSISFAKLTPVDGGTVSDVGSSVGISVGCMVSVATAVSVAGGVRVGVSVAGWVGEAVGISAGRLVQEDKRPTNRTIVRIFMFNAFIII